MQVEFGISFKIKFDLFAFFQEIWKCNYIIYENYALAQRNIIN
jgi:hypothetical protein